MGLLPPLPLTTTGMMEGGRESLKALLPSITRSAVLMARLSLARCKRLMPGVVEMAEVLEAAATTAVELVVVAVRIVPALRLVARLVAGAALLPLCLGLLRLPARWDKEACLRLR